MSELESIMGRITALEGKLDRLLRTENNTFSTAGIHGDLYLYEDNSHIYFGSTSDVDLYRDVAGQLRTDDPFVAQGSITTVGDLALYSAGTKLYFGDTAGGYDTNLYRTGAHSLATDDTFRCYDFITIGNTYIYLSTAKILFGDSAGGYDVNLYRNAANQLKTDDQFVAGDTITTGGNFSTYGNLYFQNAGGVIYWGTGAGVWDTVLYRGAANVLKTDDGMIIDGAGGLLVNKSIYIYTAMTGFYFGDSAGGYDTILYRSSANQLKTDDAFVVAGDFYAASTPYVYRNSNWRELHAFVPLTTPLTSTSWDGDAYSTTGKTLIDLSAVFGAPAGIKAIAVRIVARDSASATSANPFFLLAPNNVDYDAAVNARPSGLPNDYYAEAAGVCPCDANGDVYYQCNASSAGALDVWIKIWGYWY